MRKTTLLLVGAGHAHAKVLWEFAQRPVDQVDIVLVSPESQAPYSGMVPGWLAGHYTWQECCIDFARLCSRAGAKVHVGRAASVDTHCSELVLDNGERITYDFLSLDVGSTLTPPESRQVKVLPTRPLARLKVHWDALLEYVAGLPQGASCRIVMAGGGAAGVESSLSAFESLNAAARHVRFAFTLATSGEEILPGLAAGAARRLRAHLLRRDISVVAGFSARGIEGSALVADDGRRLPADVVLWATGAEPHAWLARSGLPVDERGFVQIDSHLRVPGLMNVFAAGDCAGWQPPLPKAGVFAVRMGPILAENLRAAVQGKPLRAYQPQRRYLVLIGTGNRHAVAAWGPLSWQGDWVWRWKQHIDRRFVDCYNEGK